MSSMRIVLVDPFGDVLFSGESWIGRGSESPVVNAESREPAAEPDDHDRDHDRDHDDADCPETLRSGGSGIFPVERANPANAHDSSTADANDKKPDERAA